MHRAGHARAGRHRRGPADPLAAAASTTRALTARAEALLFAADRAHHVDDRDPAGAGARRGGAHRSLRRLLAGLPGRRPDADRRRGSAGVAVGHRGSACPISPSAGPAGRRGLARVVGGWPARMLAGQARSRVAGLPRTGAPASGCSPSPSRGATWCSTRAEPAEAIAAQIRTRVEGLLTPRRPAACVASIAAVRCRCSARTRRDERTMSASGTAWSARLTRSRCCARAAESAHAIAEDRALCARGGGGDDARLAVHRARPVPGAPWRRGRSPPRCSAQRAPTSDAASAPACRTVLAGAHTRTSGPSSRRGCPSASARCARSWRWRPGVRRLGRWQVVVDRGRRPAHRAGGQRAAEGGRGAPAAHRLPAVRAVAPIPTTCSVTIRSRCRVVAPAHAVGRRDRRGARRATASTPQTAAWAAAAGAGPRRPGPPAGPRRRGPRAPREVLAIPAG